MSILKGFNYVEYLKRHFMIDQIDPWRRTDDDEPLYALLVSLETAIQVCSGWSGQDLGRKEFMDYLKVNNVWAFKNVEGFVEQKEIRKEERTKRKSRRVYSEDERKMLSERMKRLNAEKKARSPKLTDKRTVERTEKIVNQVS